jgi:hypothetical protein
VALVLCAGQLLAFKFHSNFNSRNKITKKNCSRCDFYFPTCAPPYTSQNFARNLLCDPLRVPLLECHIMSMLGSVMR